MTNLRIYDDDDSEMRFPPRRQRHRSRSASPRRESSRNMSRNNRSPSHSLSRSPRREHRWSPDQLVLNRFHPINISPPRLSRGPKADQRPKSKKSRKSKAKEPYGPKPTLKNPQPTDKLKTPVGHQFTSARKVAKFNNYQSNALEPITDYVAWTSCSVFKSPDDQSQTIVGIGVHWENDATKAIQHYYLDTESTNAYPEFLAAILAVKAFRYSDKTLLIKTASIEVANAMMLGTTVKPPREANLVVLLRHMLLQRKGLVFFKKVPARVGLVGNNLARSLAERARITLTRLSTIRSEPQNYPPLTIDLEIMLEAALSAETYPSSLKEEKEPVPAQNAVSDVQATRSLNMNKSRRKQKLTSLHSQEIINETEAFLSTFAYPIPNTTTRSKMIEEEEDEPMYSSSSAMDKSTRYQSKLALPEASDLQKSPWSYLQYNEGTPESDEETDPESLLAFLDTGFPSTNEPSVPGAMVTPATDAAAKATPVAPCAAGATEAIAALGSPSETGSQIDLQIDSRTDIDEDTPVTVMNWISDKITTLFGWS